MSISRVFIFLALIITFQAVITPPMTMADAQEPVIILFDESHGQFYNSTVYSEALETIEELNDVYEITINTGEINTSTLTGVDLVISTNPTDGFQAIEQYSLGQWLEKGNRGFFLLSNPYNSANSSISGKTERLNDLLQSTRMVAGLGGVNPATDLKFSINNLIKPELDETRQQFTIDTYYDNETTLLNYKDSKVNSIYYYGASVTANQKVIQTSSNVYGINSNGETILITERPTVVGSTITEQDNRVVICGSSLMFSDEKAKDDQSWLNSNDNKKLWNNIIQWLTFSENLVEIDSDIPEDTYLIMGSFTLGTILLLPIGWYFYRKGSIEEKAKVRKAIDTTPEEEDEDEDDELTKREKRLKQRLRSR